MPDEVEVGEEGVHLPEVGEEEEDCGPEEVYERTAAPAVAMAGLGGVLSLSELFLCLRNPVTCGQGAPPCPL